jgi:hypothetical protein
LGPGVIVFFQVIVGFEFHKAGFSREGKAPRKTIRATRINEIIRIVFDLHS